MVVVVGGNKTIDPKEYSSRIIYSNTVAYCSRYHKLLSFTDLKKKEKKKAAHIISQHTEACSFVSAVHL